MQKKSDVGVNTIRFNSDRFGMNLKLHTFIICFLLLKNSAVMQFGMVVDISGM